MELKFAALVLLILICLIHIKLKRNYNLDQQSLLLCETFNVEKMCVHSNLVQTTMWSLSHRPTASWFVRKRTKTTLDRPLLRATVCWLAFIFPVFDNTSTGCSIIGENILGRSKRRSKQWWSCMMMHDDVDDKPESELHWSSSWFWLQVG